MGVLSRILTWPSHRRSRLGMPPWTCTFAYAHEPSPIFFRCDIRRLDIAVRKNWESHIDVSHSRQPLVKGERLVRYEVNAVIASLVQLIFVQTPIFYLQCCLAHLIVLQAPTCYLRLLWPPSVSVSWCCCSLNEAQWTMRALA